MELRGVGCTQHEWFPRAADHRPADQEGMRTDTLNEVLILVDSMTTYENVMGDDETPGFYPMPRLP